MRSHFCWQWRHKRRAVAASAELRGGCTSAWTPLSLLTPLLHCTGQDSPQHPDSPSLTTPTTCRKVPPCPSSGHTGCCAFRVPLPACADAAALSICLPGSLGQAQLHPERRLQQLLCGLAPEGPREGSLFPDVSGHQWCCWTSGMGSLTASQARALA